MEIDFTVQIHPLELRYTLHASAALAAASACSFFLIGLYLQDFWPFALIAGAPLVWRCFSNYRNLLNQKNHPDVIRLEDRSLLYLKNGKKTIRIPLNAIAQVHYRDGLGFSLRRGVRIEVLDPLLRLSSLKGKHYDLFFHWFDPAVKTSLDNIVHANQSQHPRSF